MNRVRSIRSVNRASARIAAVILGVLLLDTAAMAEDPLVLVERVVDTRYGENPNANLDFDTALQSRLLTVKKVSPGETLQSIASNVYGITPKADSFQYAALEERIKDLNGIVNSNKLASNSTLLLPDLPHKQQGEILHQTVADIKPRISQGPSFSDVASGKSYYAVVNATQLSSLTSTLERTAPVVNQWRWVRASVARDDKTVSVIAQPLTINFNDNQANGPDYTSEIDADVKLIKKYASENSPKHQSLVVILDDSWPDEKSFEESISFLSSALVKIFSDFHFGVPTFAKQITANPKAFTTTFPFYGDGRGSHAKSIASALSPFDKISSSVKVIYVPLFKEQKWSLEILQELIRMRMIARGKGQNRNTALTQDTLNGIIATADKQTADIIKELPAITTAQPTRTDEAIISAVLYFCQLYAEDTGAPFFLNASWTISQYAVEFGPDPNLLGAVFVSAGNSESDVYKTGVLLASRAKEYPGDVIVVGNAHPNGDRSNCSSYWSPPAGSNIYGLVYDGFLSKQECGSSFSTPRVAWIMALRESMHQTISGDMARKEWYSDFRKFILGLQDQGAAGNLRYWFSPSIALGQK